MRNCQLKMKESNRGVAGIKIHDTCRKHHVNHSIKYE